MNARSTSRLRALSSLGEFWRSPQSWGVRVAAVIAVFALPVLATGPKIKGRVANFEYLLNPVWEEAKDPDKKLYSFREIVPTVPAKHRALYPHIPKELCIAALSDQKQPVPRMATLIRVGGGRTTPVTIVVTPETRLRFKNTDPFPHRLYGMGQSTLTPNDTIKGGARDWTVPSAGTFEIRDELAPSLRMWIVAEPNVATIAYPSMSGEFALRPEVAGTYTVQAYFAGKKVGPPVLVDATAGRDIDISKDAIKVAEPSAKREEKKEEAEKAAEPKAEEAK
ncbi:MAG TPA: hypothetical protein PLU22_18465 [Polyangiaceae bacterium]|nr:hypothetical protein [Polyangiaceae bacterium]